MKGGQRAAERFLFQAILNPQAAKNFPPLARILAKSQGKRIIEAKASKKKRGK